MSDLVGNPIDRFYHNEAHFSMEMSPLLTLRVITANILGVQTVTIPAYLLPVLQQFQRVVTEYLTASGRSDEHVTLVKPANK